MGLDNFWILPKKQKNDLTFDPPLCLVGGMFSGFGQGSFRGKVYSDIIEAITGEGLYQETIPNRTIKKMAASLRDFRADEKFFEYYHHWQIGEGNEAEAYSEFLYEIDDLRRMFAAYAACGASLSGWW